MRFHKILCAVDFSPCSREAMERAAELARESEGTLVLAHVMEPTQWAVGSEFQLAPQVVEDMIATEEAQLGQWQEAALASGVRAVDKVFLTGAPWDQIVTHAKNDPKIDLVVTGTRGRTGIKHVLLGSVAERVVRHAPCSVLIVRGSQRKEGK